MNFVERLLLFVDTHIVKCPKIYNAACNCRMVVLKCSHIFTQITDVEDDDDLLMTKKYCLTININIYYCGHRPTGGTTVEKTSLL